MTIDEAFQLLHDKDNYAWRQVCDSLIDIAQQEFWAYHGIDPQATEEEDMIYIENGIDYSNDYFEFLV